MWVWPDMYVEHWHAEPQVATATIKLSGPVWEAGLRLL